MIKALLIPMIIIAGCTSTTSHPKSQHFVHGDMPKSLIKHDERYKNIRTDVAQYIYHLDLNENQRRAIVGYAESLQVIQNAARKSWPDSAYLHQVQLNKVALDDLKQCFQSDYVNYANKILLLTGNTKKRRMIFIDAGVSMPYK
jgi:hypothetical protein